MIAVPIALLGILPWLVLAPTAGVLRIVLDVVALAACLHGWGLLVAPRRTTSPWLAIPYGTAVVIATGGAAAALHVFDRSAQAGVMFVGIAIHTGSLLLDLRSYATRLREAIAHPRAWVLPAILLTTLGGIQILGAAGDLTARPFDDDGNVLGQLRRLADTGTLRDGIGYARTSQLGGHIILLSLVRVIDDFHVVRMFDALACVTCLALAITTIRPTDGSRGIWCSLLVIAAFALPIPTDDLLPIWTTAGLALTLFVTRTNGPPIAFGLVVGALLTLRLELAPLVVLAAVAILWRRRKDALLTIAMMLLASAPLLVLRIASTTSELLATSIAYSVRFAWLLGLVAILVGTVMATDSARRWVQITAMTACCLAFFVGQSVTGRTKWSRRTRDALARIELVRVTGRDLPIGRSYDSALATAPVGSTIAIIVGHPELIDHAAYRIVDLRTPRLAGARLASVVDLLHDVDYVLLEDSDLKVPGRMLFDAAGLRLVDVRR